MSDTKGLSRVGLELLYDAARGLLEETDLNALLARLLDRAFEVSGAERGYLLMRGESGELEPAITRGIEPGSLPAGDPSHTVISAALKERRPVLSRNASRDPRFGGAESLIIQGIRAICCIPLEARGARVGAIYLDTTRAGRLTDEELPLLEAFGSLAALALARALEHDRTCQDLEKLVGATRFPGIVGESGVMQRLFEKMERIAGADLPVLILGESGTGKELIARALHQSGPRQHKPFRAIFCGNLTAELLESELFGYRKGAFTGAVADKPGLLDVTDKGVLFLDEIADVPPAIQAKLLRFLQDGEYQRLGDPQVRRSDVRVFSATNKSLKDAIESGAFREDLYYRLNVLSIKAPPLRERDGDLPLLAAAILNRVASRTGQPPRRLSKGALNKMAGYPWHGNVRELENVLARAAVLASGDTIESEDIDIPDGSESGTQSGLEDLSLQTHIEGHLLNVLRKTGGNRSEAARLLGVSRRYLQKTLAKWREEDAVDENA